MSLNFKRAEQIRLDLTAQQQKEIRDLYQSVADDIADRLSVPQRVPSDSLRQWYLRDLQKQVNAALEGVGKTTESTIRSNAEKVAQGVVGCNADWLKSVGMPIGGAFSWVPTDIVTSVATGQIYEGPWSLSGAIWADVQAQQRDIQTIIARGIAENKSAFDIAKDLEKYVDPSAAKPWDWSKVYPGVRRQVDYSAQRLARTMVSHAYQQSFVRTTQKNPFVTKYKWEASNSDRVCELCQERDGKLFSKDDLPLDHPNGMCTYTAVIEDSMDQIADRLADWANGAEDPELDNWATDLAPGFNLAQEQAKLSALTGKKVTLEDLPKTTVAQASDDWFEYEKCNLMKEYISTGVVPDTDLNGSHVSEEQKALIKAEALKLQDAAQKGKTGYKVLYRGMVLDEKSVIDFRRNAIYEMDSLTSTAVDRKVASIYMDPENAGGGIPAMIRVENPKGVRGFDRDGMEVILPMGAKYRVASSVYDEDGVLQVTLYASKGLG